MPSRIAIQVILCDHAVAEANGKVHMLGAGWSVTHTPTSPQAVAVLMKLPSDLANQRIALRLTLIDEDGHQVLVGDQPVEVTSELTVDRPAGLPTAGDLDASFALNVQPLPLRPGR